MPFELTSLSPYDRDKIEFALATGKPVGAEQVRQLLAAIDELADLVLADEAEEELKACEVGLDACETGLSDCRAEVEELRDKLEHIRKWFHDAPSMF